jgi:hypothetical protein
MDQAAGSAGRRRVSSLRSGPRHQIGGTLPTPQPPYGGIDDHPELLARLLGTRAGAGPQR